MLLNITTTHQPATDLGYLLHKHPDKFQTFELSMGKAHVFYPEKSETRTTVSLLLDIDPIDMVRNARNLSGDGFSLGHYVNDRPYVASSFMSAAIAQAFSTAMNGRCKDKPELVDVPLPLEVCIAVIPVPKGGKILIEKLFEPLGYTVQLERHALDPHFAEWGDSKYYTLRLTHTIPLKTLLTHLYVLIPTLDNDKHYYVSEDEINKLLDRGAGWLKEHPEKEQIVKRYLFNVGSLYKKALAQLGGEVENAPPPVSEAENAPRKENLHDKRIRIAAERIVASGATQVIDLGCGEGKLIRQLLKSKQIEKILGMDVVYEELVRAKTRLRWDEMPPHQRARIELIQGSLMYRDSRLKGFDAAAIVEVIEHLELNRLPAFERAVFEFAQPKFVVVTTPNQEFNVTWENLDSENMRHDDHRFEWTRQEFSDWAQRVAKTFHYEVVIEPLGDEVEGIGAPSQMALFTYAN
ncbi:MAG: hypothetical protein RL757_2207 [Bacteroidota bacterium]|jgi:3' terminal RNA ribose 2'-O-methyltransferase Hen1